MVRYHNGGGRNQRRQTRVALSRRIRRQCADQPTLARRRPAAGPGLGPRQAHKVNRAVSETIVRETILNRVRGSLLTKRSFTGPFHSKRCVPVSHVAIPFVLQWVYISYILICSSSPCNADRNIGRRHVCRVDQRRAPVRRLDALERLARRDVATFKTFKTFKTSRPSCPNQQGSA